ncbi:hypothetical protein SBV1_1220053 [Verrucomicrobia bacterium]|nr:hypothetical protein SBV1_1220053 [Verrucomicrobiota bacterium]
MKGEGVDWGPEAGNSSTESLSTAVGAATTFKDFSAKDFRARDILISVFDFGWSALRLLSRSCLPDLYHLACQAGSGPEVPDRQADTSLLCSPGPL